jgi:L-threonylcarbamoyladenylate synthase
MFDHGSRVAWATPDSLAKAARIVSEGGVIAFPTDTVYGLGCDLFNRQAVRRIYEIKGRPAHLPLIAMFADAQYWPQVAAGLPESARAYMERWWPGPLTIILPARSDISAEVLGGGKTIGTRIPNSPITQQLLALLETPLATTSANRSGHAPATTADEVLSQLHRLVDLIIDGGPSPQGVPSTVVDCTTAPPTILREGPITAEMLGLAPA